MALLIREGLDLFPYKYPGTNINYEEGDNLIQYTWQLWYYSSYTHDNYLINSIHCIVCKGAWNRYSVPKTYLALTANNNYGQGNEGCSRASFMDLG